MNRRIFKILTGKIFLSVFCVVLWSCGNETINKEKPEQVKSETKYYSGKIGDYEIIMKLVFSGNKKVSGEYYYLSFCEPINVSGSINGDNQCVLSERNNKKEKTGGFDFEIGEEKKKLKGNWKDAGGKKELSFEAEEFIPRTDIHSYTTEECVYDSAGEDEQGIMTLKIILKDSFQKKTDEFLLHEVLWTNTWEEWKAEEKEAEKNGEPYTGLTSFDDEIICEHFDLLSVHSVIIEGYRGYLHDVNEVFDLQKRKFIVCEDYIRKEKQEDFLILCNKKLNELIDSQLPTQEEIEWGLQDNNADYLGLVKEYMEYDRGEFSKEDASSFIVDDDSLTYVWNFGSSGPMGLYGPENRMYFNAKEIAPFLKPEGPLNFLLMGIFE